MKFARTFLLAAAVICGLFLTTPTPEATAAGPNPVVVMETSMGRIMLMLYPKDAPKTVENFLRYVDAGFYNNTLFHRVVKEKPYMGRGDRPQMENKALNIIQGGGYDMNMTEKRPLFPAIVNEANTGLLNEEGTVAMALQGRPDTATCQFFINAKDNPMLDIKTTFSQSGANTLSSQKTMGYCAFGKVIRGMSVVEKIHTVETINRGRMENVPAQKVVIKKVYRAR